MYFFEAKQNCFNENSVPLSVQMLLPGFISALQNSITTAIGARIRNLASSLLNYLNSLIQKEYNLTSHSEAVSHLSSRSKAISHLTKNS